MKFIELLKHKTIRPKQIKEVEGLLTPDEEGHVAITYEYINLDNNMHYVGVHLETHKPYWSSTTDKEFKKILMNPKSNLKLIIHGWGSFNEMKQLEYEMLTAVDAKNNPMYYNKHNGFPGVKPIDFDKVEKLRNEIDWIRDNRHDKEKEFELIGFEYLSTKTYCVKDLYSESKLQVRHETINRENLEKIKSKIRVAMGDATEEAKPPVYLTNVDFEGEHYDKLLISGNHTITAYYELGDGYEDVELPIIELGPEIHSQFSAAELYALGNDLNSEKATAKPYSKEDAEKELLRFHQMGQSWNTSRNKARMIRLGLTTAQVETVINWVKQEIINIKKRKGGWNVMDYTGVHKSHIEDLYNQYTDDDTYVCDYSGAAVKLNNILVPFHKENEERIVDGKKPKTKIKCLIRFTSEDIRDKQWPKLKEDFKYFEVKEKTTPIEYIELPMYTRDTTKKSK